MVRQREWVDVDGRMWRRRGGLATARRAEQLLRDPDVAVIVFGGPEPEALAPDARETLWRMVKPVLEGRREPEGQEDYEAAEFRSTDGGRMLAVHSYC